jgi:hypothetical protein
MVVQIMSRQASLGLSHKPGPSSSENCVRPMPFAGQAALRRPKGARRLDRRPRHRPSGMIPRISRHFANPTNLENRYCKPPRISRMLTAETVSAPRSAQGLSPLPRNYRPAGRSINERETPALVGGRQPAQREPPASWDAPYSASGRAGQVCETGRTGYNGL